MEISILIFLILSIIFLLCLYKNNKIPCSEYFGRGGRNIGRGGGRSERNIRGGAIRGRGNRRWNGWGVSRLSYPYYDGDVMVNYNIFTDNKNICDKKYQLCKFADISEDICKNRKDECISNLITQ